MEDSIAPGAREFMTTRWSLVLAAVAGQAPSETALASLCQDYWYPLYAFVRRRGFAAHDAQDLTQAFFARVLERRDLAAASPDQGRFRSYLLGALKHFLANEKDKREAAKRGGGRRLVEWDALDAEQRYELEPAGPPDAELLFDRRWAMTLLARAMERLRAEHAARGQADFFERLKGSLTGQEPPRMETAAALGMSEGTLKVAVHRLRQNYRECLRGEIAQTVTSMEDVDAEMHHLMAVLRMH